jgi:hypothetical protein
VAEDDAKEQEREGGEVNGAERMAGAADSRDNADRRALSWRTVVFGYFLSRRRRHRRSEESNTDFIDWHHPWLFFLATGTMLLSSVDAFLTLQLLERGAIEINPFMDAMLGRGHAAFTVSKMLLTGLGILVLVFLSRSRLFNFMRTGLLLTLFFSFYACLVCYQFLLMLRPF